MGRGQLKYRKRGGRGGGGPPSGGRGQSGRGGSESNSAAGAPAPSRTKRRGGGHDTSHLPSNTERWGQTFGEQQQQGHSGVSSSSSKVGFQETERLLDESEWATGASSWRTGAAGEQGADESDWDASTPAAAQKLLSLDLGVLEVCLRRLPVHERLRLPADYTAQLEAEREREDPALEPVAPVAVLPPENGEGAEGAATTATRGRETVAPGTTPAPPAVVSTSGGVGVGDDGGDDGVLDALLGLPSTGVPARVLGETGVSGGGGREEGLSPALPASRGPAAATAATTKRAAAAAATKTTSPATAPQAVQGRGHAPGGQAASAPGSPADAVVEGVGRTGEWAEVGSGGGAGGADLLEDWLDGMLAES